MTDEDKAAFGAPGTGMISRMAANGRPAVTAEPWEPIADASYDQLEEVTKRLWQMPRVRAALSDRKAPDMAIQCPKRHPFYEVTLDMDENQNLFLVATSLEDKGVVTNGWENLGHGSINARESIGQNRVRFKCPRCPYDGVWTQGDLLALYAVALQKGDTRIRLFA
jgi:hypothetical protein